MDIMIVVDNSNETSKPIKKKDKPKPAADTFKYLKFEMASAVKPTSDALFMAECDAADDDESDGSSDDEYDNDDDDDDDDDTGRYNFRTMIKGSSFASKSKKKLMKLLGAPKKIYASAPKSAATYGNTLMDDLFSVESSKTYASASKRSTTVDNAMDDLFDNFESNTTLDMLVTKSAALEYEAKDLITGINSKAYDNDEKKSDDVVVIIDPASEIELKVNNKGIKLKKQWAKLSSFLNTMIENDPKSKL
eukprot:CAMPEP_0114684986 /NCGR_PEP_ID=MMETSP0191-20121206/59863_1 /TAXON_ID=126664 /ORGANISM="Sorites sp." /LENGTH=248 /DNA_ID=CAMNT_0001968691 /DNA_START=169 /DNA_END=913 /DNA_ORIENTATION=+